MPKATPMTPEELGQFKMILTPIVAAPIFAQLVTTPSDNSYADAAKTALDAAEVFLDAWAVRCLKEQP